MKANKTQLKNSSLQAARWIGVAIATLGLVTTAELCFAVARAGQQPSVNVSAQQISNPAVPAATPESTPPPAAQQREQPANGPPTLRPSPTISGAPTSTGQAFVFPQLNDREIVVTAVGDVMLGTTFPDETGGLLPPSDGADLLQQVAPILKRGDVVFGNLEGPLADGVGTSLKCRGKAPGHCYAFRVPTRYGALLKAAGFTVMGLANNHAMDFGQEGRDSSRQTLEAQGIAHTGEIGDIAHLAIKGERVAVIAFATYPGAYNLLDLDDALAAIRQAKVDSDLVIVSFHGGGEGATHQHVLEGDEMFLGEDRGDLRRFTHAAIDAGAGLVLGSGPHVVRGMEIYQGKLIAYSLGNFATYGPFNLSAENGISLILEAHLAPDGSFLSGQVYPIKQEKPGGPKLDPTMAIVPILRNLSLEDFITNAVVVGPRGELWAPGLQLPACANAPDMLNAVIGTRPCGIYP
ncbi:MAG TPA: CapA family protein [Candidatus Angelobacter sp.]|nr:CapA family protein [Candidatus Angelobacter sp.]